MRNFPSFNNRAGEGGKVRERKILASCHTHNRGLCGIWGFLDIQSSCFTAKQSPVVIEIPVKYKQSMTIKNQEPAISNVGTKRTQMCKSCESILPI